MNCKNCNNLMFNNDKYCRKCGTKYQSDNLIIIKKIYYYVIITTLFLLIILYLFSLFS